MEVGVLIQMHVLNACAARAALRALQRFAAAAAAAVALAGGSGWGIHWCRGVCTVAPTQSQELPMQKRRKRTEHQAHIIIRQIYLSEENIRKKSTLQ